MYNKDFLFHLIPDVDLDEDCLIVETSITEQTAYKKKTGVWFIIWCIVLIFYMYSHE